MNDSTNSNAPYILGIDLGTNSVGWAIIGLEGDQPASLIRCGSRVFEAGMEGDIESGQEESRNLKRRQMRMQRRQIARRARRHRKVFHLLQGWGLLPDGRLAGPEAQQDALNELDDSILASGWFRAKCESGRFKQPDQVLPYLLRACALDEPLPEFYLGRALYHLAQRRGYRTNRKAPPKKDEKPGEVAQGIQELRRMMEERGCRTLGEYFSRLDPHEQRIRQRWTARPMFEDEFNLIWQAQAPHHPQILTAERRKQLYSAMFFQRPLWFPEKLIGNCELEPGEPRAPKYLFAAQRFRLLQNINNLVLELPDGRDRPLLEEERFRLANKLELEGDLTFKKARDLLELSAKSRFSIEKGGEKKLKGNHTTSAFYAVFGERWLEMSAEEHEQALHDLLSIQDESAMERRALNHWKLDEKAAKEFAAITPEPDYFNLSRKAIEKLLPLLETGKTYAEARRQLYPEKFEARAPLDLLPRLDADETRAAVGEIRNPAVTRSLSELRKVVNAIIRQHGKPVEIRIELARDLKRSKKDRQALTDRNRENEKARGKATEKILREAGLAAPSRTDVRKALLHEECGGICPYTGKPISFSQLFGPESQFDIEHIIPFDRCFDNSFSNVTLCESHENRHVKGRRTPWEAYHGDRERWEQILDRVKRFRSPSARAKLRRFQMTESEAAEFVSKFVDRQLNDTRYASRLAAKYAAVLYGGLSDEQHNRRVHVTSGEVTAQIRRAWKLNAILNDGPTTGGGEVVKTRDDHRHHAVDAVAIALTSDSVIHKMSRVAQASAERGRPRLDALESPWPDFVDTVRTKIGEVVVSHRAQRKVSGALHEETIYSPPFRKYDAKGKPVESVRVRKKLSAVSKSEIENIVDPAVCRLVQEKLEALGGGDPKKAFSSEKNLPCFVIRKGNGEERTIPIKSVRIEKREPARPLGEGRRARHVVSEANHHVEIYAEVKPDGSEGRWDGEVVSMLEAYRRKKEGQPAVQKDHGPQARFKFSLAPGEIIECEADQGGERRLRVVRGVSIYATGQTVITLVAHTEARLVKDLSGTSAWIRIGPDKLRQWHARKVSVSPLGDVRDAND